MASEWNSGVRLEGTRESWHAQENMITLEDSRDPAKVLKAAGMTIIRAIPMVCHEADVDGEQQTFQTGMKALFDEDNLFLGCHTEDGYHIHQAIDLATPFFDVAAQFDNFVFDFACRVKGGKQLAMSWRLADDLTVAGDAHAAYVGAGTSFDGSIASQAGGYTVRRVCANTIRAAEYSGNTRVAKYRHSSALPSAKQIRLQVENAIASLDKYKELGDKLAQYRMSEQAAEDFLKQALFTSKLVEAVNDKGKTVQVMSQPSTRTANAIDQLIRDFQTTKDERGGEVTAFTLLNTLTRFSDHTKGVKMTQDRQQRGETETFVRFENNLFGSSNTWKNDQMSRVLELAA